MTLLYTSADWDYDAIDRVYKACHEIAIGEMGLDIYPNQIEVITAEQMLDAYSSVGMPLMYKHWSFGKRYVHDESMYRKGLRGLAYEIVINSSPCISYIMKENTMTMQTLVIAHAAFGHNHFFKNNHLFRQWTDASGILEYLDFAQKYIAKCEEKHGAKNVEMLLDAAHALQSHGVHRYPHKSPLNLAQEEKREREREEYQARMFNDLWRTLPEKATQSTRDRTLEKRMATLGLPEENILYFLEKKAPRLRGWQREIIRIVRKVSQYFYPQKQTKLMNEGCATYTHYYIMNRLHEKGLISDGNMLEFIDSHAGVVAQPSFDSKYFSGFNPYALGFAMMRDIERICVKPTDEDRRWFPDFAGNGDPLKTLRYAWENFRDESFVQQFLSPEVMRKMRIFSVHDNAADPTMMVGSIHNESGYRDVRRNLARQYDISQHEADIQVVNVDLSGDRTLMLRHRVVNGILLDEETAKETLSQLANLWGYRVHLSEVDAVTDAVLKEHSISPTHVLAEAA